MTAPVLEVKDDSPIFEQHNSLHKYKHDEPETCSHFVDNNASFRLLEEINCKLDQYDERLDKIELQNKQINLLETPENPQHLSLSKFLRKNTEAPPKEQAIGSTLSNLSYLVPAETHLQIDKLLSRGSVMRELCSIDKISSDSYEYFATNNKNTFVGWSSAAPIVADTQKPQIYKTIIYLYELYTQPQIAQKLLDDALVDLESWLINHIVEAFGRTENEAFISGDGVKKPTGILSYADGDDMGKIERIKAAALNSDTILQLYYSLNEYHAAKGAFLMHRSTLQALRSLKSTTGQFLLQPNENGKETLMGVPVYQTSAMPTVDQRELPIIVFADFKSAYKIVENRDIKILRDPYTSKSFTTFYTTKRVGGGLINGNAIKLLCIPASSST